MNYVKVENGVVTRVVETRRTNFVFFCRRVFKTFNLWICVDDLEIKPQVGWTYDSETGFTE